MSATDGFNAIARTASTKGAARRLRKEGWIPAVAYGPQHEPLAVSVDPKTFINARMSKGPSFVYKVNLEGGEGFEAIIRKVDVHPTTRRPIHIDLYRPDFDKPVHQKVDIVLTGKAKGETMGGRLRQVLRKVSVTCLPKDLPQTIQVDISDLDVGDVIRVKDLAAISGVTITSRGDSNVADVVAGRGAKVGDEAAPGAEGEAEGEAAAETPAE